MNRTEQSLRRAIRIAPGLLAVFLASSRCLGAEGESPLVGTSFAIDAPAFANISGDRRAQLMEDVGKHLAGLCQAHFGFLRWAPASGVAEPGQMAARLTVRLVEKAGGFGSSISVEYAAEIQGRALQLPELPKEQLYAPWDDQPTHNPARLTSDVRNRLDQHFSSEAFREALSRSFLKAVPLTKAVRVRPTDKRLVLPVRWEALKAASDSVLHVEFEASTTREPSKPGNMKLSPDGRIQQSPDEGMVQCRIHFYSYPPIVSSGWHSDIPKVLEASHVRNLAVYMEKYVRDLHPDTRGTTVTEPQ